MAKANSSNASVNAIDVIKAIPVDQSAVIAAMQAQIELLSKQLITAKGAEPSVELNPASIEFKIEDGVRPFKGLVR